MQLNPLVNIFIFMKSLTVICSTVIMLWHSEIQHLNVIAAVTMFLSKENFKRLGCNSAVVCV